MIAYYTRELYYSRQGSENPLVCFDEYGKIVKDAQPEDVPATATELYRKGSGWNAAQELEELPRVVWGTVAKTELYAKKG